MDPYLDEIVRYLVAQSGQIAVLTVAVATTTFALRHRSAHVRYLLWLIVIAKCLIPPLHAVPIRVLPPKPAGEVPPIASQPQPTTEHSTISDPPWPAPSPEIQRFLLPTAAPQAQTHRLSASEWLGILWVAGATAYLMMNLLRALRGHLWLRKTRRPLPADVQADAANLLRPYGVRRLPQIWIMEGVGQPFAWGLLRGSIYVPPGFLAIQSPEHRRDVLAHELSHVLRFDATVNTLQVIAQGLFWFHPLVWWANRKIRQEREKCCDEMVIARLRAVPKDYSAAIIETLARAKESARPAPSLAVASPLKHIEERIRTMLRTGKQFYSRPRTIEVIVVSLAALATVPTTLVFTARAATNREAGEASTTGISDNSALPPGWSLDYDDGRRSDDSQAWPAQMAADLASLESVPTGLDMSDTSWKNERYEFEICSPNGERLGTITIRPNRPDVQMARMTLKPGKYVLRYTRRFGSNADNFRVYSGPFPVDLSQPGMYKLRFTPKLGNVEITGSLGGCYALNFERVGGGLSVTGFIYQYPPKQYAMNGLPPGTYRLSAVTQRDGPNVFVCQTQATVKADEKPTVDLTPPRQGDCSLQGAILGRPGTYRIPGATEQQSDRQWFVLIRKKGSGPIEQADAYEALTMDSLYVIRGHKIVQESEDQASYSINGIIPGEYTVTAIEHPWFEGLPIKRQQSKPLTLRPGEKAVLNFDLGNPVVSAGDPSM